MSTNAPKAPPYTKPNLISREQSQLILFAKAFTEWDRRWREEPEHFMSESELLLKETPKTYGDACAPYFMKLLDEVKAG